MKRKIGNEDEIEETEEEEEEEEEEEDEGDEEEVEIKWAKHYASCHLILLVGDGDFSFSLSLANTFGSAINIIATSLDSKAKLFKRYQNARKNLRRLEQMGATIIHEVDARQMRVHPILRRRKFDRIVYNFPHAGFKGPEDSIKMIKYVVSHVILNTCIHLFTKFCVVMDFFLKKFMLIFLNFSVRLSF
ncbi:hypothetical protein KSP40_PGU013436 [Platanthera guangdongensis]|uniref:25S rRNA (uridine-N(3))-methyltransferase BMT5-like domain-containing protein n=1 Tax=Platanthera guangdongensis TaxID=2320717 RepID=A0ABR2LBY2_9ASPA